MPQKSVIAKHWYEQTRGLFPWGDSWDYGEPSCWACGLWLEEWDEPNTIVKRWNNCGLERCHIIPRYLGGSDDSSNLVLMCRRCHALQPDSTDPKVTFEYMRSRLGAWFKEYLA